MCILSLHDYNHLKLFILLHNYSHISKTCSLSFFFWCCLKKRLRHDDLLMFLQPKNLLRCYRLRFVTSSLEEKAKPSNLEKEQEPTQDLKLKEESRRAEEDDKNKENSFGISASTATHSQSQTMRILPEISENGEDRSVTSLEASFVAAMNSVTAVGAGEEEMEQAVVKDLKLSKSLPCEWFICDDDKTATRYFIIQVKISSFSECFSF